MPSAPHLILRPDLDRVEHLLAIQVVVPAGVSLAEAQRDARAQWDTAVRHMHLQGFELERRLGIKGPYPYVAAGDLPAPLAPTRAPANREREARLGLEHVKTAPTVVASDKWEFRIWATWSRPPFLHVTEASIGSD